MRLQARMLFAFRPFLLREDEALVHVEGGLGRFGAAHDVRGDAGDRVVRRYVVEHYAARADLCPFADADVAQNLCSRAYHHRLADFRMAVARLLAGAAEGHFVQERNVVLDDGGLADDEARGVVEQNALADFRGRMNIDREHFRHTVLQEVGKRFAAILPQPVRETVGLERLVALEEKHDFEIIYRRRIALLRGHHVTNSAPDRFRILPVKILENSFEHRWRKVLRTELHRQQHRQRGRELIVPQNVLFEKKPDLRLALAFETRLFENPCPNILYAHDFLVDGYGNATQLLAASCNKAPPEA